MEYNGTKCHSTKYTVEYFRRELMKAMKEKDVIKKEVLTMLIADIKNKEIETHSNLSENEVIKIIQKQIKKLKETVELAGDRDTIVYEGQIAYLTTMLPVQYSENEIMEILNKLCAGNKNKGFIMKTVMPIFSGKADGKLVSKCVDKFIG